jgi:hypothetical protein
MPDAKNSPKHSSPAGQMDFHPFTAKFSSLNAFDTER